jgi:hypothetical protein
LSGGTPTTLVPRVASPDQLFLGLAVDTSGIYCAVTADVDASSAPQSPPGWPTDVLALSKLDGTSTRIVRDPSAMTPLASDGAQIFWTDGAGNVLKLAHSGGSVVTLASGLGIDVSGGGSGVAVDAISVYWLTWATLGDTTVMKVAVEGGAPVTLAPTAWPEGTMSSGGMRLAIDSANVYWTVAGVGASIPGTLLSVPLGGGATTTLATGLDTPSALAADGTNVYWVSPTQGTVMKVPVGGGAITTLAWNQDDPTDIALDATSVYWATDSAILRTPK